MKTAEVDAAGESDDGINSLLTASIIGMSVKKEKRITIINCNNN